MTSDVIKIANCSGFFGDRQSAAEELVRCADIDVLTGDWLAELTMLILQKQRQRDPLKGFAHTFINQVEAVLGTCLDRRIRIVSNAGGINPLGCASAVQDVADRLGLPISLGTVSGDDLIPRVGELASANLLTRLDGSSIGDVAETLLTANAYLGGWGIAACLEAGADVVVTGRVTDAALVVGPSAWAFGWQADDWDRLAGAVAAGHVIECGAQATGGNFSFFEEIDDMVHLGFPIAEMRPDGSSIVTKAQGAPGAVTIETVTAQLLYEVGSPGYLNPDVTTWLDTVQLRQEGRDRVSISGVTGSPPPPSLKVSMAADGGFRNEMSLVLTGMNAASKADTAQAALWDLIPGGKTAFDCVEVELLGTPVEDPQTLGQAVSLLRVAVSGTDPMVVGRGFSSAVIQSGLASYPGFYMTTPPGAGSSFATFVPGLVQADSIETSARVGGVELVVREPPTRVHSQRDDYGAAPVHPRDWGPTIRAPLGSVCGARSGDKGGNANIGIWVRDSNAYDWLLEVVTVEQMSELLPDGGSYLIERYELANLAALNFVVEGWLGDGVASCLRLDSQAKGLAEFVRAKHLDIPAQFLTD